MHGFGFSPSRRRWRAPAAWSHDWQATGQNPAGATFQRASSGPFVSSAPLLAMAASDVPRFPHDATTLVRRGLLMEPDATNLALYSDDLTNGVWALNGATLDGGTVTAPDGNSTAKVLRETTANSTHTIAQSFTGISTSNPSVAIFYAKGISSGRYLVVTGFGLAAANEAPCFDLTGAGTIYAPATTTVFKAAWIDYVGNGWYRIAIAVVPNSASTGLYIGLIANPNDHISAPYVGDTGKSVSIWRGGMAALPYPVNLLPTTSGAVTRAGDQLSGALSSVIPGFNPAQGTIFIDADLVIGPSSSVKRTLFMKGRASEAGGALSNYLWCYAQSGNVVFEVMAGGVLQAQVSVARIQRVKAAMRYAAGSAQLCVNNGAATLGTEDIGVTLPTGLDTLYDGCAPNGSGVIGLQAGGVLARRTYTPAAYANAQLQGLVA